MYYAIMVRGSGGVWYQWAMVRREHVAAMLVRAQEMGLVWRVSLD